MGRAGQAWRGHLRLAPPQTGRHVPQPHPEPRGQDCHGPHSGRRPRQLG